ncbi:RfaE-HldE bifunctional protein, D-beta-D-heptose 7-phosphate kinase, D-beta-D-heptose 1-phosphate adenosyltransferase [alpha proteobacterium BAL199]|nr:RfaE-HldE bifunctional protein, D-beta-D-heptose 7-phosphate kinase, D-beta-D-heptose 1-phosphate adenosyltransferase [alpha proteobacterium BAL199]
MIPDSQLAELVGRLADVRVLAVGDVMLDRFVYGVVERISPEAPVPVLRIEREQAMLGGVGNVVRNLRAQAASVCLVALVGRDEAAREIKGLLRDDVDIESHLLEEDDRPTTIKTRYIAGGQQMLRADRERAHAVATALEEEIIARAEADLGQAQALVLSDYGKGVLTERVVRRMIAAARPSAIPVIVDPKGNDYGRYSGATLVTPNRRELTEATGLPTGSDSEVVVAAAALIERTGIEAVLVTRSQDGMTLLRASALTEPLHLPATAREVYDVSGAGDTVVATVAAALAAGIDLESACRLANAAAGIVVGKIGTATASSAELAAVFRARELETGEAKTVTLEDALTHVSAWRAKGLTIGFTNGCFDLLHPGHISLLRQSKAQCDRLIVGINSDASVRRLKGEGRPIQNDASRALVLGSLASVDLVVIFGEDTPIVVIEALRPDLLVKGADYANKEVVGADVVRAHGGRVMLAALEDGHSTTATIARATTGR